MKFAWATAKSEKAADLVLFGVPDESGSHATRKGVAEAPRKIRQLTQKTEVIRRPGMNVLYQPQSGVLKKTIFDAGDIKKSETKKTVARIARSNKFPIMIGGDHSITFEALQGIAVKHKKFSVIYFDAHPDFICSENKYYGSVMCDAREIKNIELDKSMLIGTRATEREEFANMRRAHVTTITPFEFTELGIAGVWKKIKSTLGKKVYLSIDMDVLDPAFAPGVDTPVPGGLSTTDLFYLTKKLAARGLIGLDVMEVSPKFDFQDQTAHAAAHLILETVGSLA